MAAHFDWVDQQCDWVFARQQAAVDNAKLIATFLVGVAGALVGTALQVAKEKGDLEHACITWFAISAVLAIGVAGLDRIREANHYELGDACATYGWTPDQMMRAWRIQTLAAADSNRFVVVFVRVALLAQMAASGYAGYLATQSLLR